MYNVHMIHVFRSNFAILETFTAILRDQENIMVNGHDQRYYKYLIVSLVMINSLT